MASYLLTTPCIYFQQLGSEIYQFTEKLTVIILFDELVNKKLDTPKKIGIKEAILKEGCKMHRIPVSK